MTAKTYQRVLDLGLLLAQQSWTVVLDAKYDREALRHHAIEAPQAAQVPLSLVVCEAPLEVLRQRLGLRQGDIADAGPDLLERQQAEAEPLTPAERAQATVVQTDRTLEPQIESLIRSLA
jgi:predicted kinase